MGIKIEVHYPKPDIKKNEDEIHRVMTAHVTRECKNWVLSATSVIPVLTGASRATFLKLAGLVRATILISPIKKSRIQLGIAQSSGSIFSNRGSKYGWTWDSVLHYLPIVNARTGFLDHANSSIGSAPKLPQPVIKS